MWATPCRAAPRRTSIIFSGNSIRHMRTYAPTTEKIFWNVQKIRTKNFSLTYQHVTCAHQVLRKTDIFCDLCEKDKQNVSYTTFSYRKIYLFYKWHSNCRFSVEPLCERVEFRDVPTKFCVRIFQHFENVFKTKFKNREHMLPGAKTPLPISYSLKEMLMQPSYQFFKVMQFVCTVAA
jgi:hypothetical protein